MCETVSQLPACLGGMLDLTFRQGNGHIYTKSVCREAFLISPPATYFTMCPNHEFREVAEQQSNRGTPITCLRSEKDAHLKKHLRIHIVTTVDADLKKQITDWRS